MSPSNKISQLHVKHKRKAETSKTEITLEDQSPEKFEKIQDATTTEFYAIPRHAQKNIGDKIYAKNHGHEYALNLNETPVYTTVTKTIGDDMHVIEVLPVASDGRTIYIHDSNWIVYPMNLTTNRQVFPLNEKLDKEYLTDHIAMEPRYSINPPKKS